jgi:hypothetical protein
LLAIGRTWKKVEIAESVIGVKNTMTETERKTVAEQRREDRRTWPVLEPPAISARTALGVPHVWEEEGDEQDD